MTADLIALYEAGFGSEPLEELLPAEVWEKIPERFRVALTLEQLVKVIETSIAALNDATVRGAAQARWHAAKLAILSSGDSAARAAAVNLVFRGKGEKVAAFLGLLAILACFALPVLSPLE